MPKAFAKVRALFSRFVLRVDAAVSDMRDSKLVRDDFMHGAKTLQNYLMTHRNRYRRSVGAHFLIELSSFGPAATERFSEKLRFHGWHFDLTPAEATALARARDATSTYSRISNLRYATNIFEQLTNRKQLLRMIGLGAAAGSAGILLGLGELFYFAKEYANDLSTRLFGISLVSQDIEKEQLITLAEQISTESATADGTLDPTLVASRITALIERLQDGGDAEAAIRAASADTSYIIGIVTGIIILVIGKGFFHLVMEGMSGTVGKIDALVKYMDTYCDWKLGRSPFPMEQRCLPGDLIMPENPRFAMHSGPDAVPQMFRGR
jgi:hypothetical protein